MWANRALSVAHKSCPRPIVHLEVPSQAAVERLHLAPHLICPAAGAVAVCCCQLWFSNVLRDAFAAQAAGLCRPFKDIGAYHLEVLLRQAGKDSRCANTVPWAGVVYEGTQGNLSSLINFNREFKGCLI